MNVVGEKLLYIPRFLLTRKLRGGTRLTRILAERFTLLQSYRTKVNGGFLYVDLRNSGIYSLLGSAEILTEEHIVMKRCLRPGDVAYDIGANAGLFTVWLSNLAGESGKVFSFEPNPAHQRCLGETISLLSNAELIQAGLSDSEGCFEFFVPENDTMASLRDWTHGDGGAVLKTSCQVTTIDSLVAAGTIASPDFIKCDIEGGERDCFIGGRETLNRADAAIILFEANINSTKGYGHELSSGLDFLATLVKPKYSFFAIAKEGVLEPIETVTFQHGNILAVPEAKVDRIGPVPS